MKCLTFFKSSFCDACAEADKFLNAWELKNPGRIIVVRANPNLRDYNVGGFSPTATPSYALSEKGELIASVNGKILDEAEIEKLVSKEARA